MPFAVHWNPLGANKKIAKIALLAKMTFSQFLNDRNFFRSRNHWTKLHFTIVCQIWTISFVYGCNIFLSSELHYFNHYDHSSSMFFRCFFDSCDGIFLNYCWNEEKLQNTVALAGARKFDVFVGVDVFGRNMFGGGQFNTYKVLLCTSFAISF